MEKYVLIKRDLFWRPDGAGYTPFRKDAGHYKAEGGKVEGYPVLAHYTPSRDGLEVYAIPLSKAPEFTRCCCPMERAKVVEAQRDELLEIVGGGVGSIAAERLRQIHKLGFGPDRDARYRSRELAQAAACYAFDPRKWNKASPTRWPWDESWWKPTTRRADLVKAGALIAAEIDRLDRESEQ